MREPEANLETALKLGLTREEYEKILKILGRKPNFTELGMFSVMWSEHCSYKSSKPILSLFPTQGPHIIQGPGENAGVVGIGDGLCVVFKIESHNHPSAVEPFQGAATGVGGILRDIFTMGARPVALLDSLRFGSLKNPRTRYLLKGVVGGISFYGNCIGVPTVGGELYFDDSYEGNPLVNVMCVGICLSSRIVRGRAQGTENPLYYVGSRTGRDGLGGASFASRELKEEAEEDRPAVQVGDPFTEKLLLEACLELVEKDLVVGMQDMGAAGLTCSTSETASRGGVGEEIDISLIPRRAEGMSPFEVMLSESQERMLIIGKKGREREIEKICQKWDLQCVKIGKVKEDGFLRVREGEKLIAEIPARALTEEAPLYRRKAKKPSWLKEVQKLDLERLKEPEDWEEALLQLLNSPTLGSKEWVWEQYDYMVRTNTVISPGQGAALLRVKGTKKALALTCDGNGIYSFLDPYWGGMLSVAEAARNLVVVGAKPLALTDCLNFGNPEKEEVFYQFKKCVEGMAEAARVLRIPVVGGNVSFYNENPQGSIYPTPVVGMVGLIEDIFKTPPLTPYFKREGDKIWLLGSTQNDLGGTQYLKLIHKLVKGKPPRIDLKREKKLQELVLKLIRKGLLSSSQDLSEGGLLVGMVECSLFQPQNFLGVRIDISPLKRKDLRLDALLFGESSSRVIISFSPQREKKIRETLRKSKIPFYPLGEVRGKKVEVFWGEKKLLSLPLRELRKRWKEALTSQL